MKNEMYDASARPLKGSSAQTDVCLMLPNMFLGVVTEVKNT